MVGSVKKKCHQFGYYSAAARIVRTFLILQCSTILYINDRFSLTLFFFKKKKPRCHDCTWILLGKVAVHNVRPKIDISLLMCFYKLHPVAAAALNVIIATITGSYAVESPFMKTLNNDGIPIGTRHHMTPRIMHTHVGKVGNRNFNVSISI